MVDITSLNKEKELLTYWTSDDHVNRMWIFGAYVPPQNDLQPVLRGRFLSNPCYIPSAEHNRPAVWLSHVSRLLLLPGTVLTDCLTRPVWSVMPEVSPSVPSPTVFKYDSSNYPLIRFKRNQGTDFVSSKKLCFLYSVTLIKGQSLCGRMSHQELAFIRHNSLASLGIAKLLSVRCSAKTK
jgi:hypothetical protein